MPLHCDQSSCRFLVLDKTDAEHNVFDELSSWRNNQTESYHYLCHNLQGKCPLISILREAETGEEGTTFIIYTTQTKIECQDQHGMVTLLYLPGLLPHLRKCKQVLISDSFYTVQIGFW